MGGWIALLARRALREEEARDRLAGLVLIAPAVDFTEALMWDALPDEGASATIETRAPGFGRRTMRPSPTRSPAR